MRETKLFQVNYNVEQMCRKVRCCYCGSRFPEGQGTMISLCQRCVESGIQLDIIDNIHNPCMAATIERQKKFKNEYAII